MTGAGRGIGKELARALAWLQARVVIAEIAEMGAEVEALIRAEGGTALFVQTDVGDERSIQAMARRSIEAFGRVDILVNNAILYRTGTILELPLATWDEVYSVNLRGAVAAIKTFLPGMLARKEGTIVTLTSQEGMPYAASYFASKAALQSLGLSLAAELGEASEVSAFVFAPGMVDTPGGVQAFQAIAPQFGMSFEAFTGMGTNPGYPGLMPAEDCAAGFAYAIVNARDYHGQVADPFQPLARAGLLAAPPQAKGSPGGTSAGRTTAGASGATDAGHYAVVEAAREVETILKHVEREFNDLDMLRRTYARRDFQRKAGMSIDDWLAAIGELIAALEGSGPTTSDQVGGKVHWLAGNADKLAFYFRKTKEGARAFIKEPEALAAAIEALDSREKIARSFALACRPCSW